MDLKVPWKALSEQGASSSKRVAFASKQVAFFVVVGVALVGGILLRSAQFFGQPEAELNAPVTVAAPPPAAAPMPPVETTESQVKTPPPAQETTSPNEQVGQTGEAVKQTEQANQAVDDAGQPEPLGSGTILVSRQPIAMLASPSSSAPTLYGFPAGRPFRVIGHNGGFAQIQDLKSGASGWIDEAALAPPPRLPGVLPPSQPKSAAVSRQPAGPSAVPSSKATKKDGQATADTGQATDPVQMRQRPGLFGRGGLFGGIFSNGN